MNLDNLTLLIIIAGTILGFNLTKALLIKPSRNSVQMREERVVHIREKLKEREKINSQLIDSEAKKDKTVISQWYDWGDWGNWKDWRDWSSWSDW